MCVVDSEDQQRKRFQVELEFVQCLANPKYLNCKDFNSSANVHYYVERTVSIFRFCNHSCHLYYQLLNLSFHYSCLILFHISFGSTRLFQRSNFYQLSEILVVLETAGLRQVLEVSLTDLCLCCPISYVLVALVCHICFFVFKHLPVILFGFVLVLCFYICTGIPSACIC